jgi:hypothetical protein
MTVQLNRLKRKQSVHDATFANYGMFAMTKLMHSVEYVGRGMLMVAIVNCVAGAVNGTVYV